MSNKDFDNLPEQPVAIKGKEYQEASKLARRFHELYETTAPAFGYKTREETKEFDPESANGRLMAFVCYELVKEEIEKYEITKRKIAEKMCRASQENRSPTRRQQVCYVRK